MTKTERIEALECAVSQLRAEFGALRGEIAALRAARPWGVFPSRPEDWIWTSDGTASPRPRLPGDVSRTV